MRKDVVDLLKIKKSDYPNEVIKANEIKSILNAHCDDDTEVVFTFYCNGALKPSRLVGATLQQPIGDKKLFIIHT